MGTMIFMAEDLKNRKKKKDQKSCYVSIAKGIYAEMVWFHNTFSTLFFFLRNAFVFNGKRLSPLSPKLILAPKLAF